MSTREGQDSSPGDDILDVLIIGAGVAGIYQLAKARELGLRVHAVDAAGGVGGTWYWNRYPGAQLDSESYSYGYFFDDRILDEWMWSEEFVYQPELERYFNFVVDALGLRPFIELDTRIVSADFDEARRLWVLRDARDRVFQARMVVAATGMLSAPLYPAAPGLERFQGEAYHTAEWPAHDVDFTGKRVAVIGTGSSGIQVIAAVKSDVASMTVFQRTPNWATPVNSTPISTERAAEIRGNWSGIHELTMSSPAGFVHVPVAADAMSVSAEEREATFDRLWEAPGQSMYASNYRDLGVDERANAAVSEYIARKIRERVPDPAVADKLVPQHAYGTKRPPLEDNYYEAFNQPNVELIDLKESPILEFTERGLRTSSGEHEFDLIVLATGFDAVTGALLRTEITGKDGRELREAWENGPRTYLGMMVPGFPNLFLVNGPQSVNGNIPRAIEFQVDWVTRLIAHMRKTGVDLVDARDDAADAWTSHIASIVGGQLKADVDSWFFGSNVPGKPRSYLLYPGTMLRYRAIASHVEEQGYPGLVLGDRSLPVAPDFDSL